MKIDTSIFKAYDVRGIYPESLNEKIAEGVAKGFISILQPKTVVVGRDSRISGPSLHKTITSTLLEHGVNIIDIGMVSSDMYYHACAVKDLPGIMITASHNPKEYNGFKMVKKIPYFLTGDNEIKQIKDMVVGDDYPNLPSKPRPGKTENWDIMGEFVDRLMSQVDTSNWKKMKIIADTANGMVGPILKVLEPKLTNITITPMYFKPDGNFPNHGGDPLKAENREEIEAKVPKENADLGVMFDPDGDRFFVIDKKGRFISGDFMTAILSEYFLKRKPHASIVYDIRASKAVPDTITSLGGKPHYNRVGHSYIKKRMTDEDAVFGGEVTGHYYFTDFFYCDSGVYTLVYLIDYLSKSDKTLDQIVDEMGRKYFISGEINSQVKDTPKTLKKLEEKYRAQAKEILHVDGVSVELKNWRFNVRGSNTEPLIRLNLEADSKKLMEAKRDEVLSLIRE